VTTGNLSVSQLNFRNGADGAISSDSASFDTANGDITVTGGAFTGNAGGGINFGSIEGGDLTTSAAVPWP
jgi:hypothetical protein